MNTKTTKYKAVTRRTAEKHISRAKNRMFARLLGKQPVIDNVKGETSYDRNLFAETFGPPELKHRKNSTLLFWNFQCSDGATGFCLFAEIPSAGLKDEVNMNIATREKGGLSFVNWVMDRLGLVENGEEPPAFLGSGVFVISKIA
jgi:hypothetical protein